MDAGGRCVAKRGLFPFGSGPVTITDPRLAALALLPELVRAMVRLHTEGRAWGPYMRMVSVPGSAFVAYPMVQATAQKLKLRRAVVRGGIVESYFSLFHPDWGSRFLVVRIETDLRRPITSLEMMSAVPARQRNPRRRAWRRAA